MIAIVDFNHTIYDSNKYLQDLRKAVAMDESTFNAAKGNGDYHLHRHAENISEKSDNSVDEVNAHVEEILSEVQNHVYPDARKFLENFKGRKILLTRGNFDNQSKFLDETDVRKYFDQIEIVDSRQGKVDFVASLTKETDEEILFINDHPDETKEVIKGAPRKIKAYLVERPNGSFPNIGLIEGAEIIKGLDEIPTA